MFGHLFGSDAFHHLSIPPAFSPVNYNGPDLSRIPLSAHLARGRHIRHVAPPHAHARPQRQPRPLHRTSFYSETSPTSSSSSSDQDLTDDTYLHHYQNHHHHPSDSESSPFTHPRNQDNDSDTADPTNTTNTIISPFHPAKFKLAHQTFASLPPTHTASTVLILPAGFTPLAIRVSTPATTHTLRATVAGDMRFRDVVKQLVPGVPAAEVKACVRLRGEWQEPRASWRMSEVVEQGGRYVVNESGEVEVRIEVRGGRRGRGGERVVSRGGFRTWEREREMGRAWEIRE